MAEESQKKKEMDTYNAHIKERDALIATANVAASGFAKAIMTLAGGALGLSLKFLTECIVKPDPLTSFLLLASWICFGLALATITVSFLLSEFGFLKQVKINDLRYNNSTKKQPRNPYVCPIMILNILSLIAFLSGTALTIAFVFLNIHNQGGNENDRKPQATTTATTKGTPTATTSNSQD